MTTLFVNTTLFDRIGQSHGAGAGKRKGGALSVVRENTPTFHNAIEKYKTV
ncbi:hypothetical protein [Serratia sp. UGAL515B_01]|uniref:hypothetical protein n=1 Tax=Serratia sp. UGAL515B_01 TaxID=2986763 RepID=UPI002954999C|nr:hypothetical protein [Serratia sp. UGAL515B_01]WON76953.1 hypothetical protein OK023_17550 [Serratia sp. UGAL515B_01]